MTGTPGALPAAPLRTVQTLIGGIMASLVVIWVAIAFVIGAEPVSTAILLVPVALGLLAHLAAGAVGYRVRPIVPGTPDDEARRQGFAQFQASTMTRMAITEGVAILSLAGAFVLQPPSILLYAVGAVVSLLLLWWHAWPSERVIREVERRLDAAGGRSRLADTVAGRA